MRLLRTLAVAGALAAFTAWPAAAADEAHIRVLHASPDAPAVDVYLDGTKVDALTNVPFGTLSGYLPVPSGSHQVTVYATGTMSPAVIDANLSFDAGSSYTIAATNAVASIEAQVIKDDPSPVAGKAQVRVVHLSADAPAVDVAPDGADPADAIVKALSYPDATDYLTVDAGTYDLEVRLAGTSTVALDIAPISLAAGKSYSVFAIGSAADPAVGGNGLQVVAGVDATASGGGAGPTPPNTATLETAEPATPWGVPVLPSLLLLGLAAAIALAITLRPTASRAKVR